MMMTIAAKSAMLASAKIRETTISTKTQSGLTPVVRDWARQMVEHVGAPGIRPEQFVVGAGRLGLGDHPTGGDLEDHRQQREDGSDRPANADQGGQVEVPGQGEGQDAEGGEHRGGCGAAPSPESPHVAKSPFG